MNHFSDNLKALATPRDIRTSFPNWRSWLASDCLRGARVKTRIRGDLVRSFLISVSLFSMRLLGAETEPSAPVVPHPAPEIVATDNTLRARSSGQMLHEVDQAWQSPRTQLSPSMIEPRYSSDSAALLDKLNQIVLPTVNFSGMEISRVISTLGALTEEYDLPRSGAKGVNFVLLDPTGANPLVTLMLGRVTLKRLLDFITSSIGYHYEVQADAVVIRPGSEQATLETQFFPIARSTILRITGKNPTPGARPNGDALAGGVAAVSPITAEAEGLAIRNFLQLAGVGFDNVVGGSLAFDGSQLIVTQTPRNLERVRTILDHYKEVRQVQIEAKFMEVQQGALEELGVQWSVATRTAQANAGAQARYATGGGINRSLSEAFKNATTAQQISITGTGQPEGGVILPTTAPSIPGGVILGAMAGPLANVSGTIGEFDVNAIVRALSQQSGTELLSAPKLTVLSGNQATITVAQEFRYPQSYGQIQSQVGTGSNSGGGSAGVSITSGTPQEFATRNVGVELKVLPTVEEDNFSISLELNPKVTEFEGFVEYGGPSIAISGGTTVTVPPGFYQPIFAVREMNTKVTLWDGATLIMGGLTREEVKKVNDKVPVLGSLPLIGRLFRSKGESTQKRNLLIFVTARLVTPGGAPTRPTSDATTAATPTSTTTVLAAPER